MYDYSGTLILIAVVVPMILLFWTATAILIKLAIKVWRDK